ncbi:MAG: hypothetical protein ACK518_02655 [bacterium]
MDVHSTAYGDSPSKKPSKSIEEVENMREQTDDIVPDEANVHRVAGKL